MPIRSCGQSVSALRGKAYAEIGLFNQRISNPRRGAQSYEVAMTSNFCQVLPRKLQFMSCCAASKLVRMPTPRNARPGWRVFENTIRN